MVLDGADDAAAEGRALRCEAAGAFLTMAGAELASATLVGDPLVALPLGTGLSWRGALALSFAGRAGRGPVLSALLVGKSFRLPLGAGTCFFFGSFLEFVSHGDSA
jgi:hypothetical protein